MDCVVYRRGEAVGTLEIRTEGLYRTLCARIPPSGEILRLYLSGVTPAGVFVPEGDGLECRRRLSRAQLPELPAYASAWCEADGVWSPEVGGCRLRYAPDGPEQAIRWQVEEPMDFPAAPSALYPVVVAGTIYLACRRPYGNQ